METPASRPVALVTGGAARIGRALCLALADAGHDVVVHYNGSRREAEATAEAVTQRGVVGTTARADLCDIAAARRLAADVLSSHGRVDVLVNNASVFQRTPLEKVSADELDALARRFFEVHALAPLALVHALLPELRSRGGSVVNIGDAAGVRPNWAPYAASKEALESLTRSLARELAPAVRVNMVAPGAILPPAGSQPSGPGGTAEIISRVPAERLGTVEEIASAAVFLATGPAFVTGQVLGVDGGQYC